MNIDNFTDKELTEGSEVLIKIQASVIEQGSNYITVETEDGDEITISDGSTWFIEVL